MSLKQLEAKIRQAVARASRLAESRDQGSARFKRQSSILKDEITQAQRIAAKLSPLNERANLVGNYLKRSKIKLARGANSRVVMNDVLGGLKKALAYSDFMADGSNSRVVKAARKAARHPWYQERSRALKQIAQSLRTVQEDDAQEVFGQYKLLPRTVLLLDSIIEAILNDGFYKDHYFSVASLVHQAQNQIDVLKYERKHLGVVSLNAARSLSSILSRLAKYISEL